MYIERLNILSNSCNAIDDSMNVMSHHFEQNEIFKKFIRVNTFAADYRRQRTYQTEKLYCLQQVHSQNYPQMGAKSLILKYRNRYLKIKGFYLAFFNF